MPAFPDRLSFVVCLPRAQVNEAWLRDLLRAFWAHGARFSANSQSAMSWDSALNEQLSTIVMPEWAAQRVESRPTLHLLLSALAALQQGDSGGVGVGFGASSLTLTVSADDTSEDGNSETAPIGEVQRVMWFGLHVDRSEVSPFFGHERGERPYLAVFQDFLSASKVLCEITQPIYGFGFADNMLRQPDALIVGAAQALAARSALRGEMPDLSRWFTEAPLMYLPPTLATQHRLSELIVQPHWSLSRLASGGVFCVPPLSPYSIPEAEAIHHYFAAKPALERLRAADSTPMEQLSALGKEAIQHCERALGLWQIAHNQQGVQEARERKQDIIQALQARNIHLGGSE